MGGFTDDAENLSIQEKYDQQLQAEIDRMRTYRSAVEAEFRDLNIDDPETHKVVRKKIHELVPDACEVVMALMIHSESDAVRANLAKYVLTEAMKSAQADKPRDYLEELFGELAKNDEVPVDEPNK